MQCTRLWGVALLGLTLAVASPARGAIFINELFINPPGTDNGLEFIELLSTTAGVEAMTGLTFLAIDGDGSNAGVIDQALSLNSFSTGTNGLFLWRDNAAVLSPAPAPATTLNVADFNPDIENGSNTYLLVSGFTGAVGNDLDTNDDGVIDVALPWGGVADAISFIENDGTANYGYALALGGVSFGGVSAAFTPDAFVRFQNGQPRFMDVNGTSPGPFDVDPLETSGPVPAGLVLTPGSANQVPEPATWALALVGGLGLVALRRTRRAAATC